MLTKLKHQDAQITACCEHFSANQGYDGNEVYDTIRETLKARPIINNRDLWRAEKKTAITILSNPFYGCSTVARRDHHGKDRNCRLGDFNTWENGQSS